MPEKEKDLNQPPAGGKPDAASASTAAPDAGQTPRDTNDPCSCCGEMMGAMFNARPPFSRSAK